MPDLLFEMRAVLRGLLRDPRGAAAPIVLLALGIGLSTTMWSVLDGVFLRGLPFPDGDRVVTVASTGGPDWPMPVEDFRHLKEHAEGLEGLGGFRTLNAVLTRPGSGSKGLTATYVTTNLFRLLGVEPLFGRGFEPEDGAPGSPLVAVLSYATWQGQFGGGEDVLGETVVLNREEMTVVGVMPPGFHFPVRQEVWAPFRFEGRAWSGMPLFAVGKLLPSRSRRSTEAQLATWGAALDNQRPLDEPRQVHVRVYTEVVTNDRVERALWGVLVASLVLLLAACANAANLRLAAGLRSQPDLQLRRALGASKVAVLRHLVLESMVVVGAASIAGVALAAVLTRVAGQQLVRGSTQFQQFWIHVHLDQRSVLFGCAAALLATLLAGLVPSVSVLARALRQQSSRATDTARTGSLARSIVVVQVALAFALTLCTALVVRSTREVLLEETNFEVGGLSQTMINAYQADQTTPAERLQFWRTFLGRLEADPRLERAAYRGYWLGESSVRHASRNSMDVPEGPTSATLVVSPGYFRTLGLAQLAGRTFEAAEEEQRAAHRPLPVVVSRRLAERLGASADAVGIEIVLEPASGTEMVTGRIVGVVEEVSRDSSPVVYTAATFPGGGGGWVVARARPGASGALRAIDEALGRTDPLVASLDHVTFEELRATGTWVERRLSALFLVFAVASVLLGSLGLFGVVRLIAEGRTREFGVRVALGAVPRQIRRLVLRDGAWLAVVGVLLGMVASLALLRWLGVLLPGADVLSPGVLAQAFGLVAVSLYGAALGPALRAARVDPVQSLRAE